MNSEKNITQAYLFYRNQVLLIQRNDRTTFWMGITETVEKCDGDDLFQTVIRSFQEELGIIIARNFISATDFSFKCNSLNTGNQIKGATYIIKIPNHQKLPNFFIETQEIIQFGFMNIGKALIFLKTQCIQEAYNGLKAALFFYKNPECKKCFKYNNGRINK